MQQRVRDVTGDATATLTDPVPSRAGGPPVREGSTPAALSLSAD